MRQPPSEPARLHELRPEDDPANLVRLVRSAGRAPADPVPPLKWRIRRTLRRRSARRHRYLRAAVLGSFIFLTGGVVGAVVQPILRTRQQPRPAPNEVVRPPAAAQRTGSRRALAAPLLPASPDALPAEPAVTSPPTMLPPPPAALATSASADTNAGFAPAVAPAPARASRAIPQLAAPTVPRAARPPTALPPAPTLRLAPAPPPSQATPFEPPRAPGPLPGAWPVAGSVPVASPFPEPTQLTRPPGTGKTPAIAFAPARASSAAAPLAPAVPARSEPPAPVAATAPSPPAATEQALLARALRSLRSEHRPEQALAALDEYAARFANGSLAPEASRVRTEALLALGHKRAALAELNRDSGGANAGGEETRLVRAELAAAAGHWRDALGDFDALVRTRAASPSGTATTAKANERFERALWGRASARSRLGDDAGAREDLQEYLRRFPGGRFAARAAHLVGDPR